MAPEPPGPGKQNNLKRKRPAQEQPEPNRKKGRLVQRQNARVIAAQTSGKAFGDGEMNVDSFVGAQEFAIKALEDGMKSSKKSLTTRAFQNVPRDLRRRTASHNVKRVPKRLRARAVKEMREDNTPTVNAKTRKKTTHMRLRLDTATRLNKLGKLKTPIKNGEAGPESKDEHVTSANSIPKLPKTKRTGAVVTREPRIKKNVLQKPPIPKARFRKRQIHKAWLPTHLFHAKRAHMTPPKEPLWRMAIPISPTVKSYRPTHRASTLRGGMAWDMSYMSTIALEGPEKSIIGLLKALGVGKDEPNDFWNGRGATRWLSGSRAWDGWVYEREGWPTKVIAPATIFWCTNSKLNEDGKMQIDQRSKPRTEKRKSFVRVHPAAFQQLWEEILRLAKIQKPAVMVEDLRFEIGSIEVVGPGSTEALVGVLHPTEATQDDAASEHYWHILSDVANPASLPANALLAMNVSDPRLGHPQKTREPTPNATVERQERLLQILSAWPQDTSPLVADIFDRAARLAASRQLPSQKAINRRRTLSEPGQHPSPEPNDPKIPVLLLASRGANGRQGSWTLLLPWRCILPVWYSLMYYPLSTGGTLRFGGLDQKRQITFEAGTPWFPADYPGTRAGMAWEVAERVKRKKEWERRPKGKRVEFDSLKLGLHRKGEIGLGWACDWEHLVKKTTDSTVEDGRSRMYHVLASDASPRIRPATLEDVRSAGPNALIAVKITLVGRGIPTPCARVYRLPTDDLGLRDKWLSLVSKEDQTRQKAAQSSTLPKDAPPHIRRRHLAASLLEAPDTLQPGDSAYPDVPAEQHLIGFVTTGNFNLGEGKGTGLGSILLTKVLEYKAWQATNPSHDGSKATSRMADEQLCVVREAGQVMGRLARWEGV